MWHFPSDLGFAFMEDRIYRFGTFELVAAEGDLRNGDARVRLQEKPLLLLAALLDNPQKLVTREQLRECMWDSQTFVDYEQGINVAIKKLRDALGDSADNPKFIQTVAKRGYRFLLPVEVTEATESTPQPASFVGQPLPSGEGSQLEIRPSSKVTSARSARRSFAVAGIAAAVLLVLGMTLLRLQAMKPKQPKQINSLAVLPLQDLSPESGQEYFAEGITEEMITSLARSLPLRVISRTSVMRYAHSTQPITQIARELGVEAVIEGTVARSGNRVVVTVQLIDASEDRHLWAQKYDRKLEDLLGMEEDLSQEIAGQVHATLRSRRQIETRNRRPPDPQAHQLYLKGRYFWNKRTNDGFLKAAEYFRQAADIDPNYAQAYVGLADCYAFSQPATDPPKVFAMKARSMAKRALDIDGSLGEAHASLALVAQNIDRDWAGAEGEYKLAITLEPNYATAHHWYAEFLALQGRFDEALAEINTARDLDPLSLPILRDTGVIYYLGRQYDQAAGYLRKALEMDPSFVPAHQSLGMTYVQQREFPSAIEELEKAGQLDEDNPDALAEIGYAYAVSGRKQKARKVLSELSLMSRRRYISPSDYALVYSGLGDTDKAFEWLEKASSEGALLVGLAVDPGWDSLRADPRFRDFLARTRRTP